jgi:hypothetical protein
MFPKAILVDLLERNSVELGQPMGQRNMHVVYYEEVPHAVKTWPIYHALRAFVNPLRPLRSMLYWNLKPIADVVVSVPAGTMRAVVQTQKARRPPTGPVMRYLHSAVVALVSLAVLFGMRGVGHWSERLLGVLAFVAAQYFVF